MCARDVLAGREGCKYTLHTQHSPNVSSHRLVLALHSPSIAEELERNEMESEDRKRVGDGGQRTLAEVKLLSI